MPRCAIAARLGQYRPLRRALAVAKEIEEQAAAYWGTLSIGGPRLPADEQIAEVMTLFRSCGQPGKG